LPKAPIVVNSNHNRVRRRFSAAHELGHYVYHRDLIGDGIVDDVAYRTTDWSGRFRNAKILPEHETQANRFASVVLMPSALIQKLQDDRGLDLRNYEDVKKLAWILDVSDESMLGDWRERSSLASSTFTLSPSACSPVQARQGGGWPLAALACPAPSMPTRR
jgi:Zn-dependent peptidase ImmA (M78 family)